jgi:hypothetical protein
VHCGTKVLLHTVLKVANCETTCNPLEKPFGFVQVTSGSTVIPSNAIYFFSAVHGHVLIVI